MEITKMNKITPEIAELAGIFAADGSMQKEHICFWGNMIEDRKYYDIVIKDLFRKAFGIEVNPHEKASNSVYGFYVCKKKIIESFRELGFPVGSKTYTVRIPPIIRNSKDTKVLSAFIRGFSDGDGTLSFDKRYGTAQKILKNIHTYPRIILVSVSSGLINDISTLLYRLNINHAVYRSKSRNSNEHDAYRINIKGKERLRTWMKIIGFNNPIQVTKYEIFKKHGFVPVNTSLSQRERILEGIINPWDFYPEWTRSLAWIGRQDERHNV